MPRRSKRQLTRSPKVTPTAAASRSARKCCLSFLRAPRMFTPGIHGRAGSRSNYSTGTRMRKRADYPRTARASHSSVCSACSSGIFGTVQDLYEGQDLTQATLQHCLELATKSGNVDVVRFMLQHGTTIHAGIFDQGYGASTFAGSEDESQCDHLLEMLDVFTEVR